MSKEREGHEGPREHRLDRIKREDPELYRTYFQGAVKGKSGADGKDKVLKINRYAQKGGFTDGGTLGRGAVPRMWGGVATPGDGALQEGLHSVLRHVWPEEGDAASLPDAVGRGGGKSPTGGGIRGEWNCDSCWGGVDYCGGTIGEEARGGPSGPGYHSVLHTDHWRKRGEVEGGDAVAVEPLSDVQLRDYTEVIGRRFIAEGGQTAGLYEMGDDALLGAWKLALNTVIESKYASDHCKEYCEE
jgi:hypothetical protein